jgi:hypothetical protein
MARLVARTSAYKILGSVAVLGAVLLSSGTTAGASGFAGAVTTGPSSFSSGTVQLKGTTSGSNYCYSTGTGSGGTVTAANAQTCGSGSPLPTTELQSTGSAMATTTLSSVGTVNATSSTVASASCGVAQLADASTATDWTGIAPDTALAFKGLTYQATGPFTPSTQAVTTDGSTAWAETTTEYTNPETFTVLVWLKTIAPQGVIVAFANQQDPFTNTPTKEDRALWVDSAGKLVWAVYDGAYDELTSTAAVNTGSWVFVAASVGAAGTALYVNGTRVAFSTTVTAARNYSGWWTMAYEHLSGWSSELPTSDYFNGSIAQLAIVPSQLTATQVTTLYGDTTLSSYTTGVSALGPANNWALNDSGSVAYEGPVPGATASTALVDASGNANTGTAEGGTTLGASGPSTLGAGAIALNGSSGYVQTANSYNNPEGFSLVAWFKTSSASGGTVIGFDSTQGNGAPASYDRLLWVDNSGKLVWGVYTGTTAEVTSASAYNNGAWHMVVAEIGSSGQQLWVDGTQVAVNTSVTSAQSYTGYWHLGWAYVGTAWPDYPTSLYLSGSLSEAAVVPAQLTAAQISDLYTAPSAPAFTAEMAQLSPTSYWPLQDSATNVCGTTEVTVQQTVGSTNTCIYPAAAGACAAPSAAHLVTGLGARTGGTAPTTSTPVTITVVMELSSASGTAVAGLHILPAISFASAGPSTLWSAQIAYPAAGAEL